MLPAGVAGERVRPDQHHVDQQDHGAEADAEAAVLAVEGEDGVVGQDGRRPPGRSRRSSGGCSGRSAGSASRRCRPCAARRPRRPAARTRTPGSRPCGSSSRWPGSRPGTIRMNSAGDIHEGRLGSGVPRKWLDPSTQLAGQAGRVERRQVVELLDPVVLVVEDPEGAVDQEEGQAGALSRGHTHHRSVRRVRAGIFARPGLVVPVLIAVPRFASEFVVASRSASRPGAGRRAPRRSVCHLGSGRWTPPPARTRGTGADRRGMVSSTRSYVDWAGPSKIHCALLHPTLRTSGASTHSGVLACLLRPGPTCATSRSSPTSTTARPRWSTPCSGSPAPSRSTRPTTGDVNERVMDSMDLEREKGITILAKNTAVRHRIDDREVVINIIDTPGHADFGGEVERGLSMVDGVLLLVDASEGPLPQTRFVLRKALQARAAGGPGRQQGRPARRPHRRGGRRDLRAVPRPRRRPRSRSSSRSSTAQAKAGRASLDAPGRRRDARQHGPRAAVRDDPVGTIPAPTYDDEAPLQAHVTNLDASPYLGRLALCRVHHGDDPQGPDRRLVPRRRHASSGSRSPSC